MNVKEFKQWLEQFDDDVIVEVGVQEESPLYAPYGRVDFVEFTGDEFADYDYTDFRGNKFITQESTLFNKKILQLGSDDL